MSLFTVIPQGPFESNGRKQLSLSSCGWVLILSGQFKITVSQVLESERPCVNKSKLEVLVGAAGPGARRINAEIARGAYQFTFQGDTIRATTVVKYLACQVESQGSTLRGADEGYQGHQGPGRYSCGLWAPRSIGLDTKIRLWQTLIWCILLYAAEAHAWLPKDVETLEQWQNRALRHIARSPLHVSRERTQDLRKRFGVHTVVSTLQVRRLLWAKKWLREETYPEEERTGAGEAMRGMVFGRLLFEKWQEPPSRFVRQFLKDLDDLRKFVCKAEEGDRAVEDARTAAGVLGVDLPRVNPSRDQKWWDWLFAVPATNIRKLLSYATRADLWPGLPSEILRGLKRHLPHWCGQNAHDAQTASRLEAKTETHGVERVEKWPCSIAKKSSPIDQTVLLMSAHHVATDLLMCQHKHQLGQMTPQSKPPQHNFKQTEAE